MCVQGLASLPLRSSVYQGPIFTNSYLPFGPREPPNTVLQGWQIKYTHFLVDLNFSSTKNHVALKLCKDPIFRTRDIHIVSSYNGLLLCEDRWMRSVSLYISNPITDESLAIPKPSMYKKIRFTNCYSGFGFSPISDVYKVVLIKKPTDWSKEPGARVLTVGSTTWRSIEGFDEILALSMEFGVKESWTQERNICSNTCLRPSDYPQLVSLTEEGKVLLLENCGILRAYSPSTRDLARVEIDGIAWVGGSRVHIPNFVSLKDVIGF
ncbi:hypothetical protein ACFX13_032377 [Malus domestica]|uniref:F-box associated beta-propeller type 3 domain-containing protein n=1 Tax=Malus domestica TaxID=3750 RepID=A0A498JXG8_MALDO|nr:hypothetical protein DVH24_000823 [Malus domestica]